MTSSGGGRAVGEEPDHRPAHQWIVLLQEVEGPLAGHHLRAAAGHHRGQEEGQRHHGRHLGGGIERGPQGHPPDEQDHDRHDPGHAVPRSGQVVVGESPPGPLPLGDGVCPRHVVEVGEIEDGHREVEDRVEAEGPGAGSRVPHRLEGDGHVAEVPGLGVSVEDPAGLDVQVVVDRRLGPELVEGARARGPPARPEGASVATDTGPHLFVERCGSRRGTPRACRTRAWPRVRARPVRPVSIRSAAMSQMASARSAGRPGAAPVVRTGP